MEENREDTVQGESGESFQSIDCPCDTFLNVGLNRYRTKNWNPDCDVHGIGTGYFQQMKVKPYGYAGESKTTRQEWLQFRKQEEKNYERNSRVGSKPVVLDLSKT